jgi:clan AA aspartic protease
MGTFAVPVQVGSPERRRFTQVEARADTGATHTMHPRDLAHSLGINAIERLPFQLADDRVAEYDVAEVRIRLDGRERTTLVVFGQDGSSPLLGANTLELFNMAVDPARRRLVPIPGLLK